MGEGGAPLAPSDTATITADALLNGRLTLRQFSRGHRAGTDAILLAAATPAEGARRLIDIGAGVGAVGLALVQRCAALRAELVEIDPALAALASENAAANHLADRVSVIAADFMSATERRASGLVGEADVVVTNPPFFAAGSVRASPDAGRARAHVFADDASGHPLRRWIEASLALLAPGGRFVMIHRPEALQEALAAFEGRLGSAAILPIHPRADEPAHRLLIGGVKGARGPLRLLPLLPLHEASGAFTPLVEAIHRGDVLLDLGLRRGRLSDTPR